MKHINNNSKLGQGEKVHRQTYNTTKHASRLPHLLVLEFSALNTGPTSKTLPMSADIAICLYSCGDCARQAC